MERGKSRHSQHHPVGTYKSRATIASTSQKSKTDYCLKYKLLFKSVYTVISLLCIQVYFIKTIRCFYHLQM